MTDWAWNTSIVLGLTSLFAAIVCRRSPSTSSWILVIGVILAAIAAFASTTGVLAVHQILKSGQPIESHERLWLLWGGVSVALLLLASARHLSISISSEIVGQIAGLALLCGSDRPLFMFLGLQIVTLVRWLSLKSKDDGQDDPRWGLWTSIWAFAGLQMVTSSEPEAIASTALVSLGTLLLIAGTLGQIPLNVLRRATRSNQEFGPYLEVAVHAGSAIFLGRMISSSPDWIIEDSLAGDLLLLAGLSLLFLSVVMCYRARTISDWARVTWLCGWGPILAMLSIAVVQQQHLPGPGHTRLWPDAVTVAGMWVFWLSIGSVLLLFLEREYLSIWKLRQGGQPNLEFMDRQQVDAEMISGWGREAPVLGIDLTLTWLMMAGTPLTWGFWQILISAQNLTTVRTVSLLTGFIDPVPSYLVVLLVWCCLLSAYWKGVFSWLVSLWGQPVRAIPDRERFRSRALTAAALAMTMVLIGLVPGPVLRLLVRCQSTFLETVQTPESNGMQNGTEFRMSQSK